MSAILFEKVNRNKIRRKDQLVKYEYCSMNRIENINRKSAHPTQLLLRRNNLQVHINWNGMV